MNYLNEKRKTVIEQEDLKEKLGEVFKNFSGKLNANPALFIITNNAIRIIVILFVTAGLQNFVTRLKNNIQAIDRYYGVVFIRGLVQ